MSNDPDDPRSDDADRSATGRNGGDRNDDGRNDAHRNDDGRTAPDRNGDGRDGGAADEPRAAAAGSTVHRRSRDVSPTDGDRSTLAALVPATAGDRSALPGTVVVGATLLASSGLYGLVAAGIVAVLWALATPIYAATAGALLFFALADAAPLLATDPVPLEAPLAVGVAWLVLAPVVEHAGSAGPVGATVLGAVATGGVVTAALRFGSVQLAAVALVAAAAVGLYGVHRYSVVRLAYRDPQ